MPRRIFVDAEWTCLPWEAGHAPFWLGLADGEGRSWSGVLGWADLSSASEFTRTRVLPLLPDEAPRLSKAEASAAILEFCGDVDEFWAWCPTVEQLRDGFGLGPEADEYHARWWDLDLQTVKGIVDPWPTGWPTELDDLAALARRSGVQLPPSPGAQHDPRIDALWDREVHRLATGLLG